MISRHVETLFCDDIRHEQGGKLSFIGVYANSLLASSFPTVLPKLCLSVKFVTPIDKPARSLKLSVLKDDAVLQEMLIDEEQLATASDQAYVLTEEQRKEKVLIAHFLLVFSPIHFDGPCSLKVRVQTEDGELRGLSLKVALMETPSLDYAPDKGIS